MAIYKILRAAEWAVFQADGRFAGSADDLRDGYIHLSTGDQLAGTLERHFAGEAGLVRLQVAVDQDPALNWETSRGGERFPHLYRALALADVVEALTV